MSCFTLMLSTASDTENKTLFNLNLVCVSISIAHPVYHFLVDADTSSTLELHI